MTFEINDVGKICFRKTFRFLRICEDFQRREVKNISRKDLDVPGVRYEKVLFSVLLFARYLQIIHEQASIFYDNCLIEKGTQKINTKARASTECRIFN